MWECGGSQLRFSCLARRKRNFSESRWGKLVKLREEPSIDCVSPPNPFPSDASFPLLSKEGRPRQGLGSLGRSYRLWSKDSEPGSLLGRAGILALLRTSSNGLFHLAMLQCSHLLDGDNISTNLQLLWGVSQFTWTLYPGSGTLWVLEETIWMLVSFEKLRLRALGVPGAHAIELHVFTFQLCHVLAPKPDSPDHQPPGGLSQGRTN